MPLGGIKATRASALPMRNLAISVGTLDFKELPLRVKSAKKLEPSDDSNFNTLGVCSLPCDRSQTPLGRKGKHACFSKADAKVVHFFHICKFFAKKHAFFVFFSPFVPYLDYKQGLFAPIFDRNAVFLNKHLEKSKKSCIFVVAFGKPR